MSFAQIGQPSPPPSPAAPIPSTPAASTTDAHPAPTVEFDRVQDGILYFKAGGSSSLQTNLTDAQLVGVIHPLPGGDPFAILSGKTCKNCLADAGLFVLPPSGGKPSGFMFPGKIFESKTRTLAYEARGFFGRCLTKKPHDVLVIFQREIVDRKHGLLKSVMIAEPSLDHGGGAQNHLHETLLEARLPNLNDTLKMVKRHQCTEIEGRSRVMLSRPLDIQLRGARSLHDDDSEKSSEKDDDEDGSDATPAKP